MENQVTEFIGLLCHLAQRDFGKLEVPEGVVEKALAIANQGLGIAIEGLETHLSRHGTQSAYRAPTVVVRVPPVNLRALTSRYFQRVPHPRGSSTLLRFTPSGEFAERFHLLAQKDYLADYEGCIRTLLRCWSIEGRLDNLVYLSLTCSEDGGIAALLADLEQMAIDLRYYVRSQVWVGGAKRPKDPAAVSRLIRETKAGLETKLNLIKESEVVRRRIATGCSGGVFGERLLANARYLPATSPLWAVIAWLAGEIAALSDLVLERPRLLPLDQLEVLEPLRQRVNRFCNVACEAELPQPEGNPADQLSGLCEAFLAQVDQWIRALVAHDDQKYFDKFRHGGRAVERIQTTVVCYDVKGSTKTLDTLLSTYEGFAELQQELDGWRGTLGAVPRNWSVLFGGGLKTEGDQEIGFFRRRESALSAMALTLVHLDVLDSLIRGHKPYRLGLKAGIGEGAVFVAANQEAARPINYDYHAIATLTDAEVSSRDPSSRALALKECSQWLPQEAIQEEITFQEGSALRLDYKVIADAFVAQLPT